MLQVAFLRRQLLMESDLHNSSFSYFWNYNLSLLDIFFFLYQFHAIRTISRNLCRNHAHLYIDFVHHNPSRNQFWVSFKCKGVSQDTLFHHFRNFYGLLHILSLYFDLEGIFLFLWNSFHLYFCIFLDCSTHKRFNSIFILAYAVDGLDCFYKDLYFLCLSFYSFYPILRTAEQVNFFIWIFLILK